MASCCCTPNDPEGFTLYLKAKREADLKTQFFYCQRKWKAWRFRIHCRRKSSQACYLNSVEEYYREDCVLYYGDWSTKDQMKGCDPSTTRGMKKMLLRRFQLEEVDKYLTSKTCNRCQGKLKRYRRDGKLSYTKLMCPSRNCRGKTIKPRPRFMNRDRPTSCSWGVQ